MEQNKWATIGIIIFFVVVMVAFAIGSDWEESGSYLYPSGHPVINPLYFEEGNDSCRMEFFGDTLRFRCTSFDFNNNVTSTAFCLNDTCLTSWNFTTTIYYIPSYLWQYVDGFYIMPNSTTTGTNNTNLSNGNLTASHVFANLSESTGYLYSNLVDVPPISIVPLFNATDNIYIWNNTGNITFNETKLNDTIDKRINGTIIRPFQFNTTNTYVGKTYNISYYDSDSLNITEGTGSDPLDVFINFTNVTQIDALVLRTWYTGSASHEFQVLIWDYPTLSWEPYTSFIGQTNWNIIQVPVFDEDTHIDRLVQGGLTQIKIHHVQTGNPSHILRIDFIWLTHGLTGISSSSADMTLIKSVNITNSNTITTANLNVTGWVANLTNVNITGYLRVNSTIAYHINVSNISTNFLHTNQNYDNLTIMAGNITYYAPNGNYWIYKGHPTNPDLQSGECCNSTICVITTNISRSRADYNYPWCK